MAKSRYFKLKKIKTAKGRSARLETFLLEEIPSRDSDIFIRVKENDRLDLLANRFYGDSSLWWIIAKANNIKTFGNIFPGMNLRIPQFPEDIFSNI